MKMFSKLKMDTQLIVGRSEPICSYSQMVSIHVCADGCGWFEPPAPYHLGPAACLKHSILNHQVCCPECGADKKRTVGKYVYHYEKGFFGNRHVKTTFEHKKEKSDVCVSRTTESEMNSHCERLDSGCDVALYKPA